MEGHIATDGFVQENNVGHISRVKINEARAQDTVLTKKMEFITKHLSLVWSGPLFKAVTIRLFFLIVAVACFTGYTQKLGNKVMQPTFEYDQQYLEKTFKNLGGCLLALSYPKGYLVMAQTAELDPGVATVKLGSIKPGQIIEPFIDIIDDIWDFLVLSTYLVIGQIAALKFISSIAVKFFLGFGALCCAIQYRRKTVFGKIGLTLIFLFIMSYLFYPLTLSMAAKSYEEHQIKTSVQLSENLGVLTERLSDLDFSLGHIKETISVLPKILGQGLRTAWDATWGFFVGLVLMFIMVPLLTLGTIYLISRKAMFYLDMPEIAGKIDSTGNKILNKIDSRSRSKLATSEG